MLPLSINIQASSIYNEQAYQPLISGKFLTSKDVNENLEFNGKWGSALFAHVLCSTLWFLTETFMSEMEGIKSDS
jgi:hypothetical protein